MSEWISVKERLTVPDKRIDEHTTSHTVIDANKMREHAMDFYWALKRYEDTGLEPSEVEQIQRAAEYMMFESVGDFVRYAIANFEELQQYHSIAPIDRLRELAQADRDGKLPKYTIGDIIYDRFGMAWTVDSLEYVQCTYEKKWLYRCGHPGTDDYRGLYQDEVLTRAEAEAALRREQE